jgi:hypothetical protein
MEKRKNAVDQMHPKVDGMASIPKIQHEYIMYTVEKRYKTAMAITVALAILSNLIWVLCVAAGVI